MIEPKFKSVNKITKSFLLNIWSITQGSKNNRSNINQIGCLIYSFVNYQLNLNQLSDIYITEGLL